MVKRTNCIIINYNTEKKNNHFNQRLKMPSVTTRWRQPRELSNRKFFPIKMHFSPIKCMSVKRNRRVTGKSSSFVLMRSSLFHQHWRELTTTNLGVISLSCMGPISSEEVRSALVEVMKEHLSLKFLPLS